MNPPESNDFIRITREEAASSHVDDLLRRQMSLRGEPGVTRTRRHWYYQNWFVFMVVGAVAATTAWALIEPLFDDLLYVQGPIESVDRAEAMPRRFESGDQYLEAHERGLGWITIKGQRIWLVGTAGELDPHGKRAPLVRSALETGAIWGVYVEYHALGPEAVALARFLVRDPPPQRPAAAARTLAQLEARSSAAGLLLFSVVAGLIGLAVGAADGVVCRLPRRALLAGGVGLVVGVIGGFISHLLANLAYAPLHHLAMRQAGEAVASLSGFGFLVQMGGRALGWTLAGLTMGLGQGIAMRSGRLLLYGFLGGVLGGLLGGLVFDPIDLLLLGPDKPSAHLSRFIGLLVIGGSVGAMIGLVELLARDAWLRMLQGPLAGKEFLVFKDLLKLGSSPRSDVYLFNDPEVAEHHATLRASGDECEISSEDAQRPVLLNARPVRHSRLRHGDEITLGRTVFVFQRRRG